MREWEKNKSQRVCCHQEIDTFLLANFFATIILVSVTLLKNLFAALMATTVVQHHGIR